MKLEEVQYWIQHLGLKHKSFLLLESLMKGTGFTVLFYALLQFFISSPLTIIILSTLFFLTFTGLSLYLSNFWKVDALAISRWLNQRYPELQNSTDLVLLNAETLTTVQSIQLHKVVSLITQYKATIKLPHQLKKASLLFLLCIIASTILWWNKTSLRDTTHNSDQQNAHELNNTLPSPTIEALEIKISPPAYTQIKPYASSLENIRIPEGSLIDFRLRFNQPIQAASLILNGKDSLYFKKADQTFQLSLSLQQDAYFQLAWKSTTWQQSDLYPIQIILDASPQVSVDNLQQFTELTWEDSPLINIKATLQDDYSISRAQIIATVSKGSGESVKFREEKINFASPEIIQGRSIKAEVSINLKKMGLEPGDELYFYVEALDNKTIPNRSRTDTYFIALQDTSEVITSTEEGLGVDLMPEYFRSQRQIIIDTEKLIRNKKALTQADFKATSNELGYDQKVLRLRYSEFMGEEFVSGIGPQVSEDDIDAAIDEDVTKTFGHVHDSENEHNLVEHKHEDEHKHESDDPDKKMSPLEEFVHAHDEEEEATFYIQSVKAKLRAALTLMWDAELQLRLFEPAKSLPYQYKILNLLKEISNDSRIYVHRTGFDPPPIKEDKRYSADLSEVINPTKQSQTKQEKTYQFLQEALTLLQDFKRNPVRQLSPKERECLQAAGNELAIISNEKPIQYLEGLKGLSKLLSGNYTESEFISIVTATEKVLRQAMPNSLEKSTRIQATQHRLDKEFVNALEQKSNE